MRLRGYGELRVFGIAHFTADYATWLFTDATSRRMLQRFLN